MTTILWAKGQLAADSQVTRGGMRSQNPTPKIFKRKGVYYAVAGDLAESLAVVKWLVKGGKEDDFPETEGAYHVLAIKNNKAVEYVATPLPCPVKPPAAMGTGRQLALAALMAGASVRRAVEIACELDIRSSAPIKVMRTCPKKS